jgi:glutaredoxin 3
MANTIIYTKPDCPYCAKAKAWYNERSIPFEERNAQDNLAYRKEMFSFTGGDPVVPVIVEEAERCIRAGRLPAR